MYAVVRRRRLGLALAVACLAATLAALVMADAGRPGLSRARARPTSAPSRARGPSPRSSCGGASASVRLRRPGGSPSGSRARSRPASSTGVEGRRHAHRHLRERHARPDQPRAAERLHALLLAHRQGRPVHRQGHDQGPALGRRLDHPGRRAPARGSPGRQRESLRGPKVTLGTTSVSVPGAGPRRRNTSMLGMPSGEHRGRGDVGPRDRGAAAARFRAPRRPQRVPGPPRGKAAGVKAGGHVRPGEWPL